MVRIIVNPGRKVWDGARRRDATEGETLEVKDVQAKVLKFRGMASYATAEQPKPPPQPPAPPAPPARPPPPPPAPPPLAAEALQAEATLDLTEDEPMRQRRAYRRRDLRPEGEA